MSLSRDCFINGLTELEDLYTKFLSEFVKEAWYKKLRHLSDEQFVDAVSEAVCVCQFMPTAAKLIEFAGCDRFPGETGGTLPNYSIPALPSTEINVDGLTDEERAANIRRIIEEVAARMDMKKLRKKPSSNRFETMRHLLLSRSPGLIAQALTWAKGQDDVIFIYANDGDDTPCDMRLIEF